MLLYHYSNADIKDKLKVKYAFINAYSSNDKKACNIKRLFFYISKQPKEHRFNNVKYCYIIKLDKNNIYDLTQDKMNYKKKYLNNINKLLNTIKKHYIGIKYNVGFDIVCLFQNIKYNKKIQVF